MSCSTCYWLRRGVRTALVGGQFGPAAACAARAGAAGRPARAARPGRARTRRRGGAAWDAVPAPATPRASPRSTCATSPIRRSWPASRRWPSGWRRACALRLTRRHRLARQGAQPDLRRTIRRSLAHGGTPIEPAYRRRRVKPPRLVLLLDASGSMSQYSALFVRFLKGLLGSGLRTEAFVFHTRLVHVSPALRDRNPAPRGRAHGLIAQGWHGGTRIGESLAAFNRSYASVASTGARP